MSFLRVVRRDTVSRVGAEHICNTLMFSNNRRPRTNKMCRSRVGAAEGPGRTSFNGVKSIRSQASDPNVRGVADGAGLALPGEYPVGGETRVTPSVSLHP